MDSSTTTAPATPTKGKKGKGAPKKAKTAASHPKYIDMVVAAVKDLKEKGGSSRQAIVKYILGKYNVGKDQKIVNTHLKLALKRGLTSGVLKQSKGQGASGSFKLSGAEPKAAKKPASPKPKVKKSPKKAKKPSAAKPKAKKPKAAKAKSAPAAVTAAPAAAKPAAKKAAAKKKSPKKVKTVKPKAPKKASPKKKAAKKGKSPKKAKSPKKK